LTFFLNSNKLLCVEGFSTQGSAGFNFKASSFRAMFIIELFLKWTMRLIYLLLAGLLFYFPAVALLEYFARKTHLFTVFPTSPVKDSLLSLLGLALAYAVVAMARGKIGRMDSPRKNGASSGSD